MFRILSKLTLALSLLPALYVESALAVKIVRLQLEYGSDTIIASGGFDIPKTNKTVDLELYDDVTPDTVDNYLNYVNSGLYNLTFFNRSLPGLVIEAGSVANISTNPENETLGAAFQDVSKFSPILNEPGLSNLRGTVAMAKDDEDPDSATNAWYINITDNSDPLDTNLGGHTVFGSVIDDGMDIADEINSFPVANLGFLYGSAYTDIPFADYEPAAGEFIYQSNIIMILSATEISRPILRFTPAKPVFGTGVAGEGISMDITVTNMGNETLDVGSISISALSSPLTIQSENCTSNSLVPVSVVAVASCTITLLFDSSNLCEPDDRFVVTYKSQVTSETYSVTNYAYSSFDDSDLDNVLSIIESEGPNQGDGNNDGIGDDQQSNVASLSVCKGNYITLVSEDAQTAKALNLESETALSEVELNNTIPDYSPVSAFEYGSYKFNINLPNSGIVGDANRVALFLPLESQPTFYYRYGATPDNTEPHWYDFSYDETTRTGASFVGNVGITSSTTGTVLNRNMVILNFVDGERGDDDLEANGKIVHAVGGIETKQSQSDGSSGSAVYLWVIALLFMCRKYYYKIGKNNFY